MYRPTFRNPPELCQSIRDVGVEIFLSLLLDAKPEHQAYLDRLSSDTRMAVVSDVRDKISLALDDPQAPMATMYYTMMGKVTLKGRNTLSLRETTLQTRDLFFIHLARSVLVLDHGGDDVAQQIRNLSIDWPSLGQATAHVLRADPKWSAFVVVGRICDRTKADQKTRKLVEASIGRIIEKNCRRDSNWAFNRDYTFVDHVVDWFKAAVRREEPWLTNVDHLRRPKKLLKCGSFEALVQEADRQLSRRLKNQAKVKLCDLDERVLAEGGDFRLVQLLTKSALKEESVSMRHCIGHGAYDEMLDDPDCMLISLRSTTGETHGTLEVHSMNVVQFKGKANSTPQQGYTEAVMSLMPELKWIQLNGSLDDAAA